MRKDVSRKNKLKDKNKEMVRIPILDKFHEIDGELYYQIAGDNKLRKWKDYSHMNFN